MIRKKQHKENEVNMAPAKGNKHAVKLKTDEQKIAAYMSYCEWIAAGKSKESWKYTDPSCECSWRTMEKYIRELPEVLQPKHKEWAEADSLALFEEIGMKMMLGQIDKNSPAVYQMFMRNKFGWDKESHTTSTSETDVRRLLAKWEKNE